MSARNRRGASAEGLARRHLERAGLRLRTANYRCKLGEIDLVMTDRAGSLVFVEVRYRARRDFGGPAASVDARKRQRLIRAARVYLSQHGLHERPARFDVVGIDAEEQIDWITGAFSADD